MNKETRNESIQDFWDSLNRNTCEPLVLKPKKLKGYDGYKTFSIRIRDELVAEIDTISDKTGHSRNELIGIFLAYAVKNCRINNED